MQMPVDEILVQHAHLHKEKMDPVFETMMREWDMSTPTATTYTVCSVVRGYEAMF